MPDLQINLIVLLLALLIEAAIGYPDRLYAIIRHPVTWIGALIAALDRSLNIEGWADATRRLCGIGAVLVLCALCLGLALPVAGLARQSGWGIVIEALLASTLLAQRSLHRFVAAVPSALRRPAEGGDPDAGLRAGRAAVGHIVGRNPQTLDEAGVARAAIESLAENFSDGVVAPALWLAVGGLPGIVLYKAINTADSMIGHRTPRHRAFGWAAARLDDLVNLPASRLSGLLIAGAAAFDDWRRARLALRVMRRDAPGHRSPNAGWPEAAMAAALGLRLGGPRTYGSTRVDDHWMGRGRSRADAVDIDRALRLYRRAAALLVALVVALTLLAHAVAIR